MSELDWDKLLGPVVENPTKVVNLQHAEFDVYVGRMGHGFDGYFGNPIRRNVFCKICGKTHILKSETLDCFEKYARLRLSVDPEYRKRVRALFGKRLGCFCKPYRCHGDTLAQLASELQLKPKEKA